MSPYLFMLYMERLSLLISERVEKSEWKPTKITRHGMGISHLLFVDGIVLFAKARPSQMWVVMDVLKDFEKMSGLAVNVEKSKAMVFKGVSKVSRD